MPLTGQVLQPIFQGDAFSEQIATLTIPADEPDPATWTDLRFVIAGDTDVIVSSSKGDFSVPAATGTGPWTISNIQIPLTAAQTASLPPGNLEWYLMVSVSGAPRKTMVQGTVRILPFDPTRWN